jgi:hypothetical protein
MEAQGYWTSSAGNTAHATLSAAIQREIEVKKAQTQFEENAPGR